MFGFLLPLPFLGGVGPRTAVVVLILYGLLPIVRTTIAGLQGIDRTIREAGVAMGMTGGELLRQVELPLAMPSIVAGIRVAAVVGVGSATIAAAIGAGGLGEYIYRGLSMVDTTVILAGAIPAAALALVVDGGLLWLERRARPAPPSATRQGRSSPSRRSPVPWRSAQRSRACSASVRSIVVGSKNFTEQLILGEIVAQAIERETGLTVDRRLNLGGTLICDRALRVGDIDVYVEYTGTALTADLPPAAHQRFVGRARERARVVCAHRPDAAGAARVQQHLHHPRARQGRARAGHAHDRRCDRRPRRGGAPASATSFSSGRTDFRGWRSGTVCGSRSRRR